MNDFKYYATTARGLEGLLVDELILLGANDVKQSKSGVNFSGSLEIAYKACLWSRLANHVLLPIKTFKANNSDDLYNQVSSINWLSIMRANSTMKIDINGNHERIKNSQYILQKSKDAIVDQIRNETGIRPDIKTYQPDIVINIYANKLEFTFSISLSGESLHKRGYRLSHGEAPIKETLAAALLIKSGWNEIIEKSDSASFIDPMCGSGTIVIEAGMMAYGIAPALGREYFGFYGWRGHIESIWNDIEDEAEKQKDFNLISKNHNILGGDILKSMTDISKDNLKHSFLKNHITIHHQDIRDIDAYITDNIENGLILFNPPYGERLNSGEESNLIELFELIGKNIIRNFNNWDLGIIISNSTLLKSLGIRCIKKYNFYNGAIKVELLRFKVIQEFIMKSRLPTMSHEVITEDGHMFENRLRKNVKQLKKWASRNSIQCYRIYDADIPEYAVAIDFYEGHLHIQEYQSGPKVNPRDAKVRLNEIVYISQKVMNCKDHEVHLKSRKIQRGNQQYKKSEKDSTFYTVREGMSKFYVNFDMYLDTGLFLDHRIMRQIVSKSVKGKTFLNLFAYTCTASVHAAIAQAKSITSVDMSKTYLDWGKNNFVLNNLSLSKYQFIQADCVAWLQSHKEKYDVIFLDPPTFSNSKRMQSILDIQRDHESLITLVMERLEDDGSLFFSNNYRKFKISINLKNNFNVEDITKSCLPFDYRRRPNIHHCFKITHRHRL